MDVPSLETDRLFLRAPADADAALYIDFFTDDDASTFYGGPLAPAKAWGRLAQDVGHWQLRGYGVWIIQPKGTDSGVGTCGFAWPTGWPRRELTWWIAPHARRLGYAKEASQAVIAHAYTVWQWPIVETHMKDENTAARRLVESLGGTRVAREPFPDGHDRDIFHIPPPRS